MDICIDNVDRYYAFRVDTLYQVWNVMKVRCVKSVGTISVNDVCEVKDYLKYDNPVLAGMGRYLIGDIWYNSFYFKKVRFENVKIAFSFIFDTVGSLFCK